MEGIFYPAFDKYLCQDSQINVEGGEKERLWDSIVFRGGNLMKICWKGQVELNGYDSFLGFMSVPVGACVSVWAVVDGKLQQLCSEVAGEDAPLEIKGILGRDDGSLTEILLTMRSDSPQNVRVLSWLGLSKSDKEWEIEASVPVWQTSWDQELNAGKCGTIDKNLILSEEEGCELKVLVQEDETLKELIICNAREAMKIQAEEELREYAPVAPYHYRFTRVRDRGRVSLEQKILNLAVAEYLLEEPSYSYQAARLILALISMKWYEGPVCEMEGSKFHHVCFREDHLLTEVCLAAGFLGGVFKESAMERIIDKVEQAWCIVRSKCMEPGYRNYMNQGVVGNRGAMLGAAFLQLQKGGYEKYLKESYERHCFVIGNYLTENGHCPEGEILLPELGTTSYANPLCLVMDKMEYHNLACPPDLRMRVESGIGMESAAQAAYPIEKELCREEMSIPEAKILYREMTQGSYRFGVETGMLFGEGIWGIREGEMKSHSLTLTDRWTFEEAHPLLITYLSYYPWKVNQLRSLASSGRMTLLVRTEGVWEFKTEEGMSDFEGRQVYILRICMKSQTSHNVISKISWKKIEILPENSGRENTLALQERLNEGGTIRIEKQGLYEFEDNLIIKSHTHLIFWAGVFLKRASSSVGSFAMINEGAFTGDYDSHITIEGLHLMINGVEARQYAGVYGLTGELSFFRVKHLRITDFVCCDLPPLSFGIHVCTFENLVIERVRIEGRKDAVHLGRGSKFVIRHGLFKTFDDLIALNAHDYAVANPQMALSIHFDHDRYSRSVYPGAIMPVQKNLVFENVVMDGEIDCLVRSITPVDTVKVTGSVLGQRLVHLESLHGFEGMYPQTHVLLMGNTYVAEGDMELVRCEAGRSCNVVSVGNLELYQSLKTRIYGDVRIEASDRNIN